MRWRCGACDHENEERSLVCDACGVARRYFEDPPLDIPRRPGWGEIGAAYLAGTYALLALGGLAVLLSPALRAAVGLGGEWLAIEVALATAAAYGSSLHAVWLRRFNQAELRVPQSVRTGTSFDAVVTLVPYESLERVWVTIELVDRYYVTVHRQGRRQVRTRQRVLQRVALASGEPLAGRRQHAFVASFDAPIPSDLHSSVQAEIMASVLAFLGPLVPGLSHHARNLRQHGGYFVRARIRSGLWRRTYERRVVSVAVPLEALARGVAARQASPSVAGASPSGSGSGASGGGATSGSGSQP